MRTAKQYVFAVLNDKTNTVMLSKTSFRKNEVKAAFMEYVRKNNILPVTGLLAQTTIMINTDWVDCQPIRAEGESIWLYYENVPVS